MIPTNTFASFTSAFNRWYDRRLSLLTPGALLLGFLCSDALIGGVPLVPWLFAYITFVMGLGIRAREIGLAFARPLPMLAVLAVAHILLPLAAWGAGSALFGAGSPYVVGFVLLMLIPLGIAVSLPWRSAEMTATLTFACGIRNISLGIVIGLAYFRPEAAVPVVLSILIQQPGAALFRSLLAQIRARGANRPAACGAASERRN